MREPLPGDAARPGVPPSKSSPRPEDGAALLDDIRAYVRRYVVLSCEQADAVALWCLHSHALDAAEATPYLSITSAEKRSGKTRLLEVLDLLTARPWLTSRCTAAVLVRKVDRDTPTLLLDESDGAFKAEKEYAEALRSLLNAGHRRGGVASLCVKAGKDFELRDFSVFCAKAVAGIGRLPDTVTDRSITISLKRRAPGEPIERFRRSLAAADASPLAARLAAWAEKNIDELRDARPEIPALDDRAIDGWEPLIAIADLASGDWPDRARTTALVLSAGDGREDESLGVRLLADIKTIFQERGADRLPSVELAHSLNSLEESPWGDIKGKSLDPRSLAARLKPFEVRPDSIRLEDGRTPKGYLAEWFADAWRRYLSPSLVPPESPQQAQQAQQSPDSDSGLVADVADVAAISGMQEGEV